MSGGCCPKPISDQSCNLSVPPSSRVSHWPIGQITSWIKSCFQNGGHWVEGAQGGGQRYRSSSGAPSLRIPSVDSITPGPSLTTRQPSCISRSPPSLLSTCSHFAFYFSIECWMLQNRLLHVLKVNAVSNCTCAVLPSPVFRSKQVALTPQLLCCSSGWEGCASKSSLLCLCTPSCWSCWLSSSSWRASPSSRPPSAHEFQSVLWKPSCWSWSSPFHPTSTWGG